MTDMDSFVLDQLLHEQQVTNAWFTFMSCIIIGVGLAYVIYKIIQHFTYF